MDSCLIYAFASPEVLSQLPQCAFVSHDLQGGGYMLGIEEMKRLAQDSKKLDVKIDYAFAQWQPIDWFRITGGKMQNPLWRPSDLLWDTDITPEGVSAQFPFKISKAVELFLNTGYFIIDEQSSTADPYMFVVQPGVNWNITESVSAARCRVLRIGDVQGSTLD
jgi:hypothetical protein